jgi:hypothetical protein
MKAYNLLLIIVLLSAYGSCKKDKTESKSPDSSEIVLKASADEYSDALISHSSGKGDPFRLDSIRVRGENVEITVSYPGGCTQHTFEIIWNEAVPNTNAPAINLAIIHESNGESCEAYITETLTFKLGELVDSSLAGAVSVAAFSGYDSGDSTVYLGAKFDFTFEESDLCNLTVTASEAICGWGLYDNIWFALPDSVSSGVEGFYFKKYLQPVSADASLSEFRPVPGKKYTIGARYDYPGENYPTVPVCMAYPGPSVRVKLMCVKEVEKSE